MLKTSDTPLTKTSRRVPKTPLVSVKVRALLVGGWRLVREALQQLLQRDGIDVVGLFADQDELSEALASGGCSDGIVIVQLLGGAEPFATFHRIDNERKRTPQPLPLVVVAEKASRAEVYGALRIGAKAYVNLDAEPAELIKAVTMAAANRAYLAPDAAQLLVSDVSDAVEPGAAGRLPGIRLTGRELEVVRLMCEGLSSKEIGRALHISPKTVENHRYNIYRKCGVESLAALVRLAIQQGLVSI
ncbi:hypothetical protein LCGC14_0312570 [marine sediment metagenome]|uniref:HTH luxR-type domain-containing protein n=1 Tax=marine sediment metagenome TaxID=412755 RepID=A0A0F9TS23_9ZZZZ|nr:response regulator transcription factor [Phycisphaerae bacterium]HDZ44801.1 response regulator transcription factor [Phycisphaerae bacterium]